MNKDNDRFPVDDEQPEERQNTIYHPYSREVYDMLSSGETKWVVVSKGESLGPTLPVDAGQGYVDLQAFPLPGDASLHVNGSTISVAQWVMLANAHGSIGSEEA